MRTLKDAKEFTEIKEKFVNRLIEYKAEIYKRLWDFKRFDKRCLNALNAIAPYHYDKEKHEYLGFYFYWNNSSKELIFCTDHYSRVIAKMPDRKIKHKEFYNSMQNIIREIEPECTGVKINMDIYEKNRGYLINAVKRMCDDIMFKYPYIYNEIFSELRETIYYASVTK